MNKEQFEGKWQQLKGKIKEKWGKITDDDLARIKGNYEQFLGVLKEHYGYKKEEAEKFFKDWNWENIIKKEDGDHKKDHPKQKK